MLFLVESSITRKSGPHTFNSILVHEIQALMCIYVLIVVHICV